MIIKKTNGFLVSLCILVFLATCLSGCGANTDSNKTTAETDSAKAEPMPKNAPKAEPKSTGGNDAGSVDGWQSVTYEKFKFSLPKDWNGDTDANVWWPGEGSLSMGRPPVSLHLGATPVMPGASWQDRSKSFMNAEPSNKTSVTVCGLEGFTCEWKSNSYKHYGLFLVEKVGGGMKMLYFANCQAPSGEYDNHSDVFKKIIASITCK